ncbi:MAG: Nif3-like dinuclear metal center hexameric protein [Bacteroidia bacterium]|nr:Nif3-like dinuclear metal center hexameric protein [Bacteroidia bacterium]
MNNPLVSDIIKEIENFAPLTYQENYDNAGLIIGNADVPCTGVLLTLDVTEDVIKEAIQNNCNLIVAHHPLIFAPIKQITGKNYVERCIIKAIKNNINIYAAHTNADNIYYGVNKEIADRLGLINTRILLPKNKILKKLVTFVPETHLVQVQNALFQAGCGHIGNYDSCSFYTSGKGTFRGNELTNPFVGEKNKLSVESEIRLETIFEAYREKQVINALLSSHPYEEVAYDVYLLDNYHAKVGSGIIGELKEEIDVKSFLHIVKDTFCQPLVRYTPFEKKIKKVALCGGSGSFLLNTAIHQSADVFISSDFKYHQFFDADKKIMIVDIGHYEAEQFTPEIFYRIIKNKFPNFATLLSKTNTNPIKYI